MIRKSCTSWRISDAVNLLPERLFGSAIRYTVSLCGWICTIGTRITLTLVGE